MTHSPLTTGIQLTTDYDSRRGTKVDHFIIHHSAATSQQQVVDLMMPGGRDVSANYSLKDKSLILVVDEDYRAWTSGSPDDGGAGAAWDRRSITIEVCNESLGGDWPISQASFDTLARLIADCARRYGFPINDEAVITHQELWGRYRASYPTACPGPWLQSRKAELLALANKYWAAGNGPAPAPKPKEDTVMERYNYTDRSAQTVAPGKPIRMKNGTKDRNVIGIASDFYSITAAVKVKDLAPGDAVSVRLLIHNTKTGAASGDNDVVFVAGKDGVAAGQYESKLTIRTDDGPKEIWVEVTGLASNEKSGTVVWIDSDAYAFKKA